MKRMKWKLISMTISSSVLNSILPQCGAQGLRKKPLKCFILRIYGSYAVSFFANVCSGPKRWVSVRENRRGGEAEFRRMCNTGAVKVFVQQRLKTRWARFLEEELQTILKLPSQRSPICIRAWLKILLGIPCAVVTLQSCLLKARLFLLALFRDEQWVPCHTLNNAGHKVIIKILIKRQCSRERNCDA